MAFFWRCPECETLGTYDDDERPWCHAYCDYPDDDGRSEDRDPGWFYQPD